MLDTKAPYPFVLKFLNPQQYSFYNKFSLKFFSFFHRKCLDRRDESYFH